MNKISVIIPTRNRANNLKSCLCSLSKQTTKPYEIVVCDNASKDNTQSIVEKFNKKLNIKYVYEENIGISSTRNTAIRASSGEIIAFIDDDCTTHKDWIEKIIKNEYHLKKYFIMGMNFNKNYGNIFSDYIHFTSIRSMMMNANKDNKNIIISNYLDTKNAIVSRKQLNRLNIPFNKEFDKLIYEEDVELGIRLNNLGYKSIFIKEINVTHNYIKSICPFLKKRFLTGRGIIKNKSLINKSLRKNKKLNKQIENLFSKNDLKKIELSEKEKNTEFLKSSLKQYISTYYLYKKLMICFIFKLDELIINCGIIYQKILNKLLKSQ